MPAARTEYPGPLHRPRVRPCAAGERLRAGRERLGGAERATADGLTANAIPKGQEVLIVIGEGLEKERIEVRLKGKGGFPVYRCIFP